MTDTARADDIFVSLDRLQAAFQHSSTPVEQQAGSDARSPGHVGHRHPGLHRPLDQPDLLGGRPTATPLDRRDHFNTRHLARYEYITDVRPVGPGWAKRSRTM